MIVMKKITCCCVVVIASLGIGSGAAVAQESSLLRAAIRGGKFLRRSP